MKTAVLIPYFGGRLKAHERALQTLAGGAYTIHEYDGCPYIDMAEALLVERALRTDAEVFLFIEQDITFGPGAAGMLVQHLLGSDYDSLAALYAVKKRGAKRVTALLRDPPKSVTFFQPGLWPAYFTGLGFTAIRRRVFEHLQRELPRAYAPSVDAEIGSYFLNAIEPIFDYSSDAPPRELYNGNDVSFFNRARRAGFRVGVDFEPRIGHIGPYEFHLEDAYASLEPETERSTIPAPPP